MRLLVPVWLAVFGFGMSAFGTILQHRVMEVAPGNVDVASAGSSAAFNVGIGAGALVGGLLLPAYGVRTGVIVGGMITFAALAAVVSEPILVSHHPAGRRYG